MSKKTVESIAPSPVSIILDKERKLFYNLSAIAKLTEQYGTLEKLYDALATAQAGATALTTEHIYIYADLVAAGLMHEDPEMDRAKVLAIFPISQVQQVSTAIQFAFTNQLPPPRAPRQGGGSGNPL